MKEKKRKISIAVISTILALVLTFGSTMAWQSVNQIARNERLFTTYLGGRLHDDFDGQNKDVYVENYGDQPIVVRIMLKEFLEFGPDAGQTSGAERTSVDSHAVMQLPETWTVHTPVDDPAICHSNVHKYLTYKFGGETTYLPTFNKNQDSLVPDINGTFKKNFEDYVDYSKVTEPVVGNEVYDKDKNNEDEGAGAVEGVNITTKKGVKHTTAQTLTSEVITMDKWIAPISEGGKDSKPGPYWVYDADGWAYWAQPLEPQTATGLLLDEVTVENVPGENFYFGIDVICQCATLEDLGENHKTGFYDTSKGPVPSENAKTLLATIGASSKPLVAGDEIKKKVQTGSGDPDLTVDLDGIEFYVLDVTDNKALILSKYGLEKRPFNTSTQNQEPENNQWKDSELQNYLNNEWLTSKPILQSLAVDTTLHTRSEYNSSMTVDTVDKVFLLSEADVFGTSADYSVNAQDYTLGVEKTVLPSNLIRCYGINGQSSSYSWLRSPRYSNNSLAVTDSSSSSVNYHWVYNTGTYVRPALIIDLDKLPSP